MEEPTAAQMAIILAGLVASPVVVLVAAELLRWRVAGSSRWRLWLALGLGAVTCQVVRGVSGLFSASEGFSLGALAAEPLDLVVLAPLHEELAKALMLAMLLLGLRVRAPREGFVLGAAVGLGFAALENLLFLGAVPSYALFVRVALERTVFSPLVHGVGPALVGAALAARRPALGAAALAVGLAWHGGSNALVLLPMTLTALWIDRGVHALLLAGAAVVVAVAQRRLPAA